MHLSELIESVDLELSPKEEHQGQKNRQLGRLGNPVLLRLQLYGRLEIQTGFPIDEVGCF